ncbi:MAG: DUF433 domain-containing protein [Pirellulales bacterium]|nr:DUF433 domain-containing protein [Pirellulales bacterium]
MSLPIYAEAPPLREGDGGVVYVAETGIPLERVIRAFQAGMTPEQVVQDFDVLAVEDVYAVINYYLHHRPEVDEYLNAAASESDVLRDEVERSHDPAGVRDRLLARRPMES